MLGRVGKLATDLTLGGRVGDLADPTRTEEVMLGPSLGLVGPLSLARSTIFIISPPLPMLQEVISEREYVAKKGYVIWTRLLAQCRVFNV